MVKKYTLKFSKTTLKQLKKINDIKTMEKIKMILDELVIDPYATTHKFERLKSNFAGYCSKRLNHKDRILYQVVDNQVTILVVSVLGHY